MTDPVTIQKIALHHLEIWVEAGDRIPNDDYNKAAAIIAKQIQSGGELKFHVVKFALSAFEDLFPVDLCSLVVKYLSVADRINIIRKLNKFWKQIVGKLKLEDLCSTKLTIREIDIIFESWKVGIWLDQQAYEWKDLGVTEKYWRHIYKTENTNRHLNSLVNFKCLGVDKIWHSVLNNLGCYFVVRGWVYDGETEFVINEIAETWLRGIRPLHEEYQDALDYESPEEEIVISPSTHFYKAAELTFLNQQPKKSWSIIRHENGLYESKLNLYLILEVYASSEMETKLKKMKKDKYTEKGSFIDLTVE